MVALLPADPVIADLDVRVALEFAGADTTEIVRTVLLYDEIARDPNAHQFPVLLTVAAAVDRAGKAAIDDRADFCRSSNEIS